MGQVDPKMWKWHYLLQRLKKAVCQAYLNILTIQKVYLEKKSRTIPGPSVKALKVTQDEYETDKDNKVSSSVEGSRQKSVCISPYPLLNTPPPFDNKRDYKGDTHDESPDSSTKYTNVFKKEYANLKKNLD